MFGEKKIASCPTVSDEFVQSSRIVPVFNRINPEVIPLGAPTNPPAKSSCRSALVLAPRMVGPNFEADFRLTQSCTEASSRIPSRPRICEGWKVNVVNDALIAERIHQDDAQSRIRYLEALSTLV